MHPRGHGHARPPCQHGRTMDFNASLSRFYALPVTAAIAAAVDTDFADTQTSDLVHAHLSRNPLYFGGIDKTLSGFVVLDDAGDNYTLIDVRGGGQVWWQDHETRQVEPRFASLDEYVAFRARLSRDPDDEASLLQEYAFTPNDRDTGTAALLDRYQWVMHALALSARRDDQVLLSADTLVVDAFQRYIGTFPEDGSEQRCFDSELPRLGQDTHVALYWLLHASLLGQDDRLAQVLAAVGRTEIPLLQAFVATFGHLPNAPLTVVDDFAHRRARLLILAQADTDGPVQLLLRALAMSPRTVGLDMVDKIALALEQDPAAIDAAVALQLLDRIPDRDAPAVWALRAFLQAKQGLPAQAAADQATRLLAASPHAPLETVLALHPIRECIGDGRALLDVVTPLLAWDDLMTRVLDLLEHAQHLCGEQVMPADALAQQRGLAEDVLAIWDAPSFAEGVAAATPAAREAMAIRLARTPSLADTDADRAWALHYLLDSALPGRCALLQRALPQLSPPLQRQAVPAICKTVTDAGDPLVPMLVTLAGQQPLPGDIAAELDADARADAIIAGLQPFWGDPRLFDPLIAMLERAPLKSVLVDRLGNAIGVVLPVLDTDQRQRLLHWAVPRVQAHEDDHWTPRILSRLESPDLAPALCAVLEAESNALAAGQPASETVLKAMYDNLGEIAKHQPDVASYLVQRLWQEHAYPRGLYWALYICRSPAVHAQVMQALRARPSVTAAATYCPSIHSWDRYPEQVLEVAEHALAWPLPDNGDERGYLNYILLLGSTAALTCQQPALARALYQRAADIDVPAREIGSSTAVFDPYRDGALRAQLQDALDGKAEKQRAALHARLHKARAKGVPDTGIPLAALGQLAGGTATFAWFRHPVTGATLFQDALGNTHYFDGHAIVAPPFQLQGYTLADTGPALFDDATEVSERWMCWKGDTFYDWARLGAAINVVHGASNGHNQVHLALRCATAQDAADVLAGIRAHPLAGYVACDPWYLAGSGEIARTLYHPEHGGGLKLFVSNGTWLDRDRTPVPADVALATFDSLEAAARRAGGFTYSIECLDNHKRPQDQPLLEWFVDLGRRHASNVPQALEQTTEPLQRYLAAHALLPPGTALHTHREAPAAQADIDALAADQTHPLPDVLVACWQHHASIGWQFADQGMRLLPPGELLAITAMDGRRPLLVDARGTTRWVLDDTDDSDRQVIPADHDADFDAPADEALRSALIDTVLDIMEHAVPNADLLWYGQRGDADVQFLQLASASHVTQLRLDRDAAILAVRKGKRGQAGKVRIDRFQSLAKAEAAFTKARKAAEAGGATPHP